MWKLPSRNSKIKNLSEVLKCEMTSSEVEYERKQQNKRLSWVEKEIQGLQRLKRLLLFPDSPPVESNTIQNSIHDRITRDVAIVAQPQSKNLYDAVDTESHDNGEIKSYKSSENQMTTKGNAYEKFSDIMTATEQLSVKPRFRNICKSMTINEEQLLDDDDDNHGKTKHREKIGIPPLTCKINDNNESLRDLILQRKQNFFELYKNKRHSHYEIWKLRQKEREEYKLPCVQRVTDSPLHSQKSSDMREKVS
uniref:PEHE domain-containing protein n=1 Tax=Glossina palpalis gambiensis TaxID=67801 RepID=A0A1B0AL32_9MUSC